jgi:hypothetical protein
MSCLVYWDSDTQNAGMVCAWVVDVSHMHISQYLTLCNLTEPQLAVFRSNICPRARPYSK